MDHLVYVGERHVIEFTEFMILKNFSKRTIHPVGYFRFTNSFVG